MPTRTWTPRPTDIDDARRWVLIDAEGQILGRLASDIAYRLRGKDKPIFSPHADVGDYVVVINAGNIRVTGRKLEQKVYYRHSGYPGGLKQRTLKEMLRRRPEQVLELAVRRMLPKGALGERQYKKLKVYAGPAHPHEAQRPVRVTVDDDRRTREGDEGDAA